MDRALDSSLPEWKHLKISGAIVRDVGVVEGLAHSGIPVIFAQHNKESYAPFPAIITESKAIGCMAAEHFLDRGFQNFAYCGLDDFAWSRGRGQHFSQRLAQAGFEVNIYRHPTSEESPSAHNDRNEQNLIAEWLRSLPKPVAVMCCNDDRALQVIEACKQVNYDVPDRVSVLGVDNDVLVCDLADPPISSIALNTEGAGYEAARLLDRLMKGEPMAGQTIGVSPTHIVTRMSTDVLAVSDQDVSTALQFIRRNPNRLIQVNDVVEATNVSRRVLEKRFKSILEAVGAPGDPAGSRRPHRAAPDRHGHEHHGNRDARRIRRRRAYREVLPERDRDEPARLPETTCTKMRKSEIPEAEARGLRSCRILNFPHEGGLTV